jgi:hypothetical protein
MTEVSLTAHDVTTGTVGFVRRHTRAVTRTAKVLALVVVVYFLVVPQIRRSSHSLPLLFDMDSAWIPVAVAAELTSLLCYGLATRAMLMPAHRPALHRVLRMDLSAIALGHCLPDGGAAGTALCWRLLVKSGVPSAHAAFAKVAQGVSAAVVLQALLLVCLLVGVPSAGFSHWTILPVVVAASVLMAALLTAIASRSPRLRHGLAWLAGHVPFLGSRVSRTVTGWYGRHVEGQLRSTVHDGRRLSQVAIWAGSNWWLDAVALWASLHAYGPGVGVEAIAVSFSVACLATWLPITPSGLGVSEALMIPALMAFGSHRAAAVLGILTWRVLAFWLPIPIGALAYASLSVRGGRNPNPPGLRSPPSGTSSPA